MSYNTAYKGEFLNQESDINNLGAQKLVLIWIYDTESGEASDPGTIIPLEMADTPLKFEYVNNDEGKFNVFCSLRAVIRVHSSNTVDTDYFADGGDNRWYVEIFYESQIKFKGWLSIGDMGEDYQPHPNIIEFIATDGLGFLEAEELKDFDGDNPVNENTIMDYLCWALSKTGLELDIWAIFNIREKIATPNVSDDSGDGHFFKYCYLDAKTFEAEIGVSEDCRTVIEKILKREARIMQRNGVWVIVRLDELQYGDNLYVYKYDFEGTFISKDTINPVKEIGVDKLCSWMNDDTVKMFERPIKYVLLGFDYIFPQEMPCNNDFARGDFIEDLPDETIEGKTYQVKSYDLENWEFAKHRSNGNTPVASDTDAYVKKLFYNNQESERYIHIDEGGTHENSYKSCKIPVSKDDKFDIGIAARYSGDTNQVTRNLGVELVADDGTYYYALRSGTRLSWFQYPSGNDPIIMISNDDIDDLDYTDWQSVLYEADPIPKTGKIYIYLYEDVVSGSDWVEYGSFFFEFIPIINGSYQKYSGQSYKITQPTDPDKYKAFIDDKVFISDAPRRSMKGCLLKPLGDDFQLTEGFYNAAVFPDGFPDISFVHPYGWLQVYDNWNQYSRTMRKFEGTIDRLDEGTNIPDLLLRYHLTDVSPSTNDKEFMALHAEQDVDMCETDIFLHEVDDDTIGKTYPANEFKYLTE